MNPADANVEFAPDISYAESEDDVLEPLQSEIDDTESSPPEYHLSTYPADFTLEVLHHKWNNKELVIPAFQRRFVWKMNQSSKLIESFLHNLPVPPVYFYTEPETGNLLVVDGQQRLKTIFYFLDGIFGEEDQHGHRKVFRLQGLSEKSPWYGKTFDDLVESGDPAAKRLHNSVLRAFVVQQLDPKDDTSVFHIFERLNTGGTALAGQEIRNCLMSGPFNDRLLQVNQDSNWRKVFGKPLPDIHMRDVELIVRVFALRASLNEYEKPMKDFLSRFMRRYRFNGATALAEHFDAFQAAMRMIVDSLGPKPFHIRAGLNAAVYDSTVLALMACEHIDAELLQQRFAQLTTNDQFVNDTATGTTDVDTVKSRIATARAVLTP